MSIDKNDVVNTALTAALMFVDSSNTFFKEDGITSTQRFINPGFEGYLLIDGKYYPREQHRTLD